MQVYVLNPKIVKTARIFTDLQLLNCNFECFHYEVEWQIPVNFLKIGKVKIARNK